MLADGFFSPLVQADTAKLRGKRRLSMDGRIQAEHHLAAIGLLRRLASLRARLDVIIDGGMEGLLQFAHTLPMKPDDIVDAGNVADKETVGCIEFNPG